MFRRFDSFLWFGLSALVAWWLFADTYARHFESTAPSNIIRFAHFGGHSDFELWRDVIEMFERDNPGVQVRQEYVVGFSGRYTLKLRQQIMTGTAPDVAMVQLAPFHRLAEHFADLQNLTGHLGIETVPGAGIEPSALAAFQSDGVQRGLPVSGGNLLIYYNPNCFERAEAFRGRKIPRPTPDWTMVRFQETAELLTCDFDDDGRLDQFGFWLPRWIYYQPFLWSFGGSVCDETTGQWNLADSAARKALDFYRDLASTRRVCPRPEEVPQMFQDVGFLTGKVGMCINGPWFQPFLDATKLKDLYRVAHIPAGEAGRATRITWDGVVVAANLSPPRNDLAQRFAGFLLSHGVQQRIARSGRALPARVDTLSEFVAPPGNPVRQPFIDALNYSRLQPPASASRGVDRALNGLLARLADPAETASIDELVEDLMLEPTIATACDVNTN